jgi:predicted HTH transcriptional regulator
MLQTIDLASLKKLVSRGEGYQLEFKRKVDHPLKILKEVVAFANSQGGKLLIGVDDDLSIPGLKLAEGERYLLEKHIELYCKPAIAYQVQKVKVSEHRTVLVFEIKSGKEKPYSCRVDEQTDVYRVFVRHNDKSIQASKEVRTLLKIENEALNRPIVFGEKEKQLLELIAQKGGITLHQYSQECKLPIWLASKILVAMVSNHVLKVVPNEQGDVYMEA